MSSEMDQPPSELHGVRVERLKLLGRSYGARNSSASIKGNALGFYVLSPKLYISVVVETAQLHSANGLSHDSTHLLWGPWRQRAL